MVEISQKLTNLQLELLQLYDKGVSDGELQDIREFLATYFAKKTVTEANKLWNEEKWDESKMNELLNSHLRITYNKE